MTIGCWAGNDSERNVGKLSEAMQHVRANGTLEKSDRTIQTEDVCCAHMKTQAFTNNRRTIQKQHGNV